MVRWLKKHFIPHGGNNHRPHILRTSGLRNIVIAIIFFETFTFLIPTLGKINMTRQMAAVLPAVLSSLTNKERQVNNLPALKVNPLLTKAAQEKADDMAKNGYFAHTSPDGKTPWYWIEKVGYRYQYAGENLAVNFTDSKDVTSAWMASPTHRANIEKSNYTEIGTGVANGIYEGQETIFVAQEYANPLPEAFSTKISTKVTSVAKNTKVIKEVANSNLNSSSKRSNVLGIETVNNDKNNNLPIQKTSQTSQTSQTSKTSNISNTSRKVTTTVSVIPIKAPTFLQKMLASPRNTTKIILYGIFIFIFIALLLYIIIKRRNHHFDLITNALIALAIIGALLLMNYYLTNQNTINTKTIDYSRVQK